MTQAIHFGTDGVRGPAGQWPVSEAGAERIGLGIAAWSDRGEVCIGSDTRESGPALVDALVRGLVRGGAHAVRLGVLPTAGVSAAVAADGFSAGVMVTASHNPWQDNGLKVVGPTGEKLVDPTPLLACFASATEAQGGTERHHSAPLDAWMKALPSLNLNGRRILLDGAHGAGSLAASSALRAMGAEIVEIGNAPNGRNINAGVGAMCPPTELLGCDFAICLDGDADRLVMVDPEAGVLNGDDLLWMLAQQIKGPVVGTVMSNGGLEAALDGRLVRTAVGDAKVHAEMVRIGAAIGGEPSGHIMLDDGMPTSDGLYTALRILEVAGNGPLPLHGWKRWPQAHRNVRDVRLRTDVAAIKGAENEGHRVLVRASGTEPLVRIMVEGDRCEHWATAIESALVNQTG